jgi:Co/Zn/Cd efflux system component
MLKASQKLTIYKAVVTAAAIAISALFFLLLLEELHRFVRIREGMASWVALMGLVVSGIAELAFIIWASDMLFKQKRTADVTGRSLSILSLFGWLFVLLGLFKVWTFVPNPLDWPRAAGAIWTATDYLTLATGLAAAIGGNIGAIALRRPKK